MNKSIFNITRNEFETMVKVQFNQDNTDKLLSVWNSSLDNNEPDFSVYGSKDYFLDIWNCWMTYSRKYIKNIKDVLPKNIKSIVDLGCGMGFTTTAFHEIYPKAIIYGTNIKNTKQWKICNKFAINNNFNIVENIDNINKTNSIDLLFASEYFEHILNPIEQIIYTINKLHPKYMVIANSFNTEAIGHFRNYLHNNESIPANKISRLFNKAVKSIEYYKMETEFWNSRPTVWVRNDQIKSII